MKIKKFLIKKFTENNLFFILIFISNIFLILKNKEQIYFFLRLHIVLKQIEMDIFTINYQN